jgi:sucrose-6-phosphate hydrolase SacC (GH32 family)
MSNWMYANEVPATSHRSAMSFPRELSLVTTANGLRLKQAFPKDGMIEQSRGELWGSVVANSESIEISPADQASLLSVTVTADEAMDILLKPYGTDAFTYRITQDGNEIVVQHHRHIKVAGEEQYQKHFAHDNEFRFPVADELTLDIVRDTTSCEILFDSGLTSTTETMFNHRFGAFEVLNQGSDIVINTVKEFLKG